MGDEFEFIAPEEFSDPLEGTITYDLEGAVVATYSLAPIGAIGVEALGAEITLEEDGVEATLGFGPLLDESISGSLDSLSLELFRTDAIEIPDEFLPDIVEEFSIAPASEGQDIAFVIDTTGSMSDDIDAVKAQAAEIISAIFGPAEDPSDSRIAVVGYNDPATTTFLSFTDHDSIEDRKTAAINAINSITVGGGGDFPEAVFGGLLRALDGRAGEWREEATARRIILFGDAPPNDYDLADQVYALANNISVGIGVSARDAASLVIGDVVETETLVEDGLYKTTLSVMAADRAGVPISTFPVEIYTAQIGSDGSTEEAFDGIAGTTGGSTFVAADAGEVVETLLSIVSTQVEFDGTDDGEEITWIQLIH